MKVVVGPLALMVVLGTVGCGFWAAGDLDRRMVASTRLLLTMEYAHTAERFEDIARSGPTAARFLPWSSSIRREARQAAAIARFWESEDAAAAPFPAPVADDEPAMLLLAANAAFRIAQQAGGDPSSIRQMEQVLDSYTEILKRDPEAVTAAYNYEYVARVRRQALATNRASEAASPDAAPRHTIHGKEGAARDPNAPPPLPTLTPLDGDERRETKEAGKSAPRKRRG